MKITKSWKIGILIGIFWQKSIFLIFAENMPIKMPIFYDFVIFINFDISGKFSYYGSS